MEPQRLQIHSGISVEELKKLTSLQKSAAKEDVVGWVTLKESGDDRSTPITKLPYGARSSPCAINPKDDPRSHKSPMQNHDSKTVATTISISDARQQKAPLSVAELKSLTMKRLQMQTNTNTDINGVVSNNNNYYNNNIDNNSNNNNNNNINNNNSNNNNNNIINSNNSSNNNSNSSSIHGNSESKYANNNKHSNDIDTDIVITVVSEHSMVNLFQSPVPNSVKNSTPTRNNNSNSNIPSPSNNSTSIIGGNNNKEEISHDISKLTVENLELIKGSTATPNPTSVFANIEVLSNSSGASSTLRLATQCANMLLDNESNYSGSTGTIPRSPQGSNTIILSPVDSNSKISIGERLDSRRFDFPEEDGSEDSIATSQLSSSNLASRIDAPKFSKISNNSKSDAPKSSKNSSTASVSDKYKGRAKSAVDILKNSGFV